MSYVLWGRSAQVIAGNPCESGCCGDCGQGDQECEFRHTAYPACEPAQPAPAESCTHYGMEDEGEPLTLAESVRFWLLMGAPAAVAVGGLALLLVWSAP